MLVVVGTNHLYTGGSRYRVLQVIWHEAYSQQDNRNDVAVLKISGSITYSSRIQSISLTTSPTPAGTQLLLTGWGLTRYPSQQLPSSLQQISLTAISIQQCKSSLPSFPVYNTHLCTYKAPGQGACQGDSGGPLVAGETQVGIVSWGIPCATGRPDVFTSVHAFRGWITSKTGV